jgi:predicted enzyme related to lactoylglutathione lyase
MRYTAMIVGFLLATLTQVGAAEIGQSDYVEFTVHDLATTKAFYSAVFGWTFATMARPTRASTTAKSAAASRRTVRLILADR